MYIHANELEPKLSNLLSNKNLKRKDFNFLTKSYRFFTITHEKVKKFQVLRKCPLVIFGSSGKLSKTTKKDF